MAFADLLVHTAAVRRRPVGADGASPRVDRLGQPIGGNPSQTSTADLVGTYPCRVYTKSGGLVNEERSMDVFEDVRQVFLLPSADVQEDDVLTVIDSTGFEVMPPAKVRLKQVVYGRSSAHHIELDLIVQRGPA